MRDSTSPDTTQNPSIVVAFLNYNTADECLRAYAAIPEATQNIPVTTVIIDNGSTDDSLTRFKELSPPCEILPLPRNCGFAAAFNQLFDRYQAQWYLLLNSDIIVPPQSIRALYDAVKNEPRVGITAPAYVRENGSPQTSHTPFPSLGSELINRRLFQRMHAVNKAQDSPIDVDTVIGAAMFVPRSTIDTVGPLDERFFFFFEETDWCRRIHQHNLRVLHVPFVRFIHLQGKAANKAPIRARIQFHYSRLLYFQKHHGTTAARILRYGMTVRCGISAFLVSIATLLTAGRHTRTRMRAHLYAHLFMWYISGCSPHKGLQSHSQ